MKQPTPIIVVPIATSAGSLADLRKAGYVPLLCDDPSKVALVTAGGNISGSDMLVAAMQAMTFKDSMDADEIRATFMRELYRRMKIAELEQAAKTTTK